MGWGFLTKVLQGDERAGGGVFGFLQNAVNAEEELKKKVHRQTSKVTGQTNDKAVKAIRDFGVSTARETVRAPIQFGLSAINPITHVNTINPSDLGRAGELAFGKKNIDTLQTGYKAGKESGQGTFQAGASAALIGALDITPFAGGKKKIAEQLSKASTPSEVKKILGKDIADDVASAIAHTKDKGIIDNLLNKRTGVAQATEPNPAVEAVQNHLNKPQKPAKPEKPVDTKNLQVIARAPIESPQLRAEVESGKLKPIGISIPTKKLQRLGTETQDAYDVGRIGYYKDKIKNGETLDPVVVSVKKGEYYIQDGKHRVAAMRQLGIKDVPVVMRQEKPLSGAAQQSNLSKQSAFSKYLNPANEGGYIKLPGQGKEEGAKQLQNLPVSSDASIAPDINKLAKATIPTPKPPVVKGEVTSEGGDVGSQIIRAIRGTPSSKGISPEKGAKAIRKEQETLYSQARGKKIAGSEAAGKNLSGSEGYFAEKRALKGDLPKTEYGGLNKKVGAQEAERLFSEGRKTIQQLPDKTFSDLGLHPQFAKFNTQSALRKVTHGEEGVPTNSDIKLLEAAFGKDFAKEVHGDIPLVHRARDILAKMAGLPRALQASLDLSMGGRQGAVLGALHPKAWTRANIESVKYLAKPKYYKQEMTKIGSDPYYETITKKMKVALQAVEGGREEAYASADWAEKVPGILASERAYNGGLTKLRFDVAKNHLQKLEEAGIHLDDKALKQLGEVINTASGRGGKSGGLVERHMETLSTTLFSPRLWASRLNMLNPQYYIRLKGPARAEALKAAGAFSAVAGTVLAAGVSLGGKVETDARSSDFLKLRFGDTRYDVLGGFQQNLVALWREVSNEKKSSTSGKVAKLSGEDKPYGGTDRLGVIGDLVSNKLNPVFGEAKRVIKGQNNAGDPLNPLEEVARLFTPLNFQSIYDTSENTGSIAKGVAKSAPGFVGIGSQTYGLKDIKLAKDQQSYVDSLKNKGAPKAQIEASERFFQTQKTGPDRDAYSKKIKSALQSNDIAKAEQIAQEYNKAYGESFKDWLGQSKQYADNKDLIKSYNSKKITSSSFSRWIADINKGGSL